MAAYPLRECLWFWKNIFPYGETHYDFNASDYPKWYADGVLKPLRARLCVTMPQSVWINDSFVQLSDPIDRATGRSVSYAEYCNNYPAVIWLAFVGNWLRAWNYAESVRDPDSSDLKTVHFFFSRFYSQMLVLFSLASPLYVCSHSLGLFIIAKVLRGKDMHVRIMHEWIAVLNLISLAIGLLSCTGFIAYLFLPLCWLSKYTAYSFLLLVARLSHILFDAIFWLIDAVQATLALDRFVALYLPIKYNVYVTARNIKLSLWALLVFNFIPTSLELVFNTHAGVAIVEAGVHSQQFATHIAPMRAAIGEFRNGLLVGVLGLQACLTLAVLLKVAHMKWRPVAGAHSSIPVLPCALLFSTSIVNGFCNYGIIYAKQRGLRCELNLGDEAHTVYTMIRNSQDMWRLMYVPGICSVTFVAHCIVSSVYRKAMLDTIRATARRLCRIRGTAAVAPEVLLARLQRF